MPIVKVRATGGLDMTEQFEMKIIGVFAGLAILEAVGIDLLGFAHKILGALIVSGFAG